MSGRTAVITTIASTLLISPFPFEHARTGAVANQGQAGAGATEASPAIQVWRNGTRPPRNGPATHFVGSVRVEPLFQAQAPSHTSAASVTFEPGAHSAWHVHPLGQYLIVTAGVGRVQQWGGLVIEIRSGDVVWTPPGVKHWHGAAPNSPMTHIAIQEEEDGKTVEWLEKVSDQQYNRQP
jgi:quercetin dioxygenase-like cupin family protein